MLLLVVGSMQMHATGLGADSFTTNALLRACFRADNLGAAMAVVMLSPGTGPPWRF